MKVRNVGCEVFIDSHHKRNCDERLGPCARMPVVAFHSFNSPMRQVMIMVPCSVSLRNVHLSKICIEWVRHCCRHWSLYSSGREMITKQINKQLYS